MSHTNTAGSIIIGERERKKTLGRQNLVRKEIHLMNTTFRKQYFTNCVKLLHMYNALVSKTHIYMGKRSPHNIPPLIFPLAMLTSLSVFSDYSFLCASLH